MKLNDFNVVSEYAAEKELARLYELFRLTLQTVTVLNEDVMPISSDLDFAEQLEQLSKRFDAAKRGLGLVNKLKPGPEKSQHLSRVMKNLNQIRRMMRSVADQLEQFQRAEQSYMSAEQEEQVGHSEDLLDQHTHAQRMLARAKTKDEKMYWTAEVAAIEDALAGEMSSEQEEQSDVDYVRSQLQDKETQDLLRKWNAKNPFEEEEEHQFLHRSSEEYQRLVDAHDHALFELAQAKRNGDSESIKYWQQTVASYEDAMGAYTEDEEQESDVDYVRKQISDPETKQMVRKANAKSPFVGTSFKDYLRTSEEHEEQSDGQESDMEFVRKQISDPDTQQMIRKANLRNPFEENEEGSGKFAIYFDYTGAGRGPEPVAGPFNTREEAEEHAATEDINLNGSNYFVDVVDPEFEDEEIGVCEFCHRSTPMCEC